ncbi:MAG: nucleotidyltransferase domain-containing protein [Candidatus Cloacimonetes bacterium]|nr:nucleotidyltransferase domain-containing protein [Candidatus Cloacimonadota bacterium]
MKSKAFDIRQNELMIKREQYLKEADKIADFLKQNYRVEKVVLFGSVLNPDRFNSYSDIDLLVYGLKADYLSVYGGILGFTSLKFDLIPEEKASPYILKSLNENRLEL